MSLEGLLYWHWLVAGLALLILEAFFPGAIFLWLGVSAFVVGALLLLIPIMSWQVQLILFSVLSITAALAWRKFRPARQESDRPHLNRRGAQYVGRVFTLDAPIVNGIGVVRVDDSQWRVSGPDAPAGARMRVLVADGATLKVERAD